MKASFPYRIESSHIFGQIRRPVAPVSIWSNQRNRWLTYTMIVDTGADYTLLPYSAAEDLKLDLEKEAHKLKTFGIGGSEPVYFIRSCKIKVGKFELTVPIGVLARDDIPPLLGRQKCLDKLRVLFAQFITSFNTL